MKAALDGGSRWAIAASLAMVALFVALWFSGPRIALGERCLGLEQPAWLLTLLGFPVVMGFTVRARAPAGALLATTLAWAALSLGLCVPYIEARTRGVHVALLADMSQSISAPDQARRESVIAQLKAELGPDDALTLVRFAGRASAQPRPDSALLLQDTDLEQALSLSLTVDTSGKPLRILVVSDGVSTVGTPERALPGLRARNIELHSILLSAPRAKDASVASLDLPDTVALGRTFDAQVTLESNYAGSALLTLEAHGEGADTAPDSREVTLRPGTTTVDFSLRAAQPGLKSYQATLQPVGDDAHVDNNHVVARVEVVGPQSVLVVSRRPQSEPIMAALPQAGFVAEVRPPSGLSPRASDLAKHACIVLSDLNRSDLDSAQVRALHEYVQLGGAVLTSAGGDMLGQDAPRGSDLAALLPLQTRSRLAEDEARSALALLIDASGSMAGEKLDLAKAAAIAAAKLLDADDLLEVVGFAGAPLRAVRLQRANNTGRIALDIQRLLPHGGTALRPALELAREDLSTAHAALKHIVLLTDGQTDEQGLPGLAQLLRAEGITLSTVGLGPDVERDLLASLSNLGGGRAHFTDDPRAIPRIFMQETSHVRRESAREGRFRMVPTGTASFLRHLHFDTAPFIRKYMPAKARGHAVETLLRTDRGDTLLARRRLGVGFALSLATDLNGSGSSGLLSWSQFPRLLSGLITAHSERTQKEPLPVQVTQRGARLLVRATAPASAAEGACDVRLQLESSPEAPLQMQEVAPARFELELPRPEITSYAQVILRREGTILATGRVKLPQATRDDLSASPSNGLGLERLSERSGGQFAADPRAILRENRNEKGRGVLRQGLQIPLLVAGLVAFLVGVPLRRWSTMRANA